MTGWDIFLYFYVVGVALEGSSYPFKLWKVLSSKAYSLPLRIWGTPFLKSYLKTFQKFQSSIKDSQLTNIFGIGHNLGIYKYMEYTV